MQQWGREGIYQSQSLLAFALVLAIALPLFVLDLFFIPPATTLFNRNWIQVPAMISTATGSVSVRPNCGEDQVSSIISGKHLFFFINPDLVALQYFGVYYSVVRMCALETTAVLVLSPGNLVLVCFLATSVFVYPKGTTFS